VAGLFYFLHQAAKTDYIFSSLQVVSFHDTVQEVVIELVCFLNLHVGSKSELLAMRGRVFIDKHTKSS
jgi:hypothetical protein